MNTSLIVAASPLPVQRGRIELAGITPTICLDFITKNAGTLRDANFTMLGAGVLYVYSELVWFTDRSHRKSRDDVKASLAKAFGETARPNSNISRSKRYEFASLCVELARHKDMKSLAAAAAQTDSVALAARHLSIEFGRVANSVAALARHFGTERSSGRRREPIKRPFLVVLRALVEQAELNAERIPFVDSVNLLASAAAQRDIFEALKRLIPTAADDALPEIIDIASHVIDRRRANA